MPANFTYKKTFLQGYFKKQGMSWTRESINNLLALRDKKLNQS